MSDLAQALSVAIEAAREAGALLRQEFHRPGGPRGTGGHAEIDQPAEQLIQDALLARFRWDYLGEELGYVNNGNGRFIWLVDPNDGTASYLRGSRGSAVSIAALRDGIPVLGVVYAFSYPDDEGDLVAWAEGCELTRNGKPVTLTLKDAGLETDSASRPVVLLSQDADRNPQANTDCVRPARYIALPSIAYRLARVAAGDGVAAVSLNGPVSWDYAGGHALLRGAGGVLVDQQAAIAVSITSGSREASYNAALTETECSNAHADVRKAVDDARHAAPADFTHQMGWVLIALQNAFYQLLHAPSLEEGVVATVMHGGDTDTNAAIAGALLGAAHGRKEVPSRWLETLLCCRPLPGTSTAHPQPPEFWPVDAMELAEALLVAAMT